MIAAEIQPGQRWHATSGPDDVIEIVRPIEEWLWLVRTATGAMVEMADCYIMSTYTLETRRQVLT